MTETRASAIDLVRVLVPELPLREWIGDRLPGTGPFAIRRITSGRSNELFVLERDNQQCLLRRPPRVANAPGAHDMGREFRVQRALQGSRVPHAEPILLCEDVDVIGAPFYLMGLIDGVRLYDSLPPPFGAVDNRHRVAEELFDTLGHLHNVDWEEADLRDFGRPESFTQRQVSRWMKQLSRYQMRDLPDLFAAAEWLEGHIPTMQRPALIHGDYGLHNVLYAPEPPVRLSAVLDWETATIGDPLIDLGYLLGLWLEGDEPERWTAVALPYPIDGFPSRDVLSKRYAAQTGLDLSEISWYRAVAQLKVACILEGGHARYLRDQTDDPEFASLGDKVLNHSAYALAITRGEA